MVGEKEAVPLAALQTLGPNGPDHALGPDAPGPGHELGPDAPYGGPFADPVTQGREEGVLAPDTRALARVTHSNDRCEGLHGSRAAPNAEGSGEASSHRIPSIASTSLTAQEEERASSFPIGDSVIRDGFD